MPDEGGTQQTFGAVEPVMIQEEMERSFLEYAMSVITARALPDVKDGLKPVQRRILWGMYDIGARPDRSHMKCARVTGSMSAPPPGGGVSWLSLNSVSVHEWDQMRAGGARCLPRGV